MLLSVGDPLPWIDVPTRFNPLFALSALGGRFTVLVSFGDARLPAVRAALARIADAKLRRDDYRWKIFGITAHPDDTKDQLVQSVFPDERVFLDIDWRMGQALGAVEGDRAQTFWLIADPQLRVVAVGPLSDIDRLLSLIPRLPPAADHLGPEPWAPVLLVPYVLEPTLVRALIAHYTTGIPEVSGHMDQRDGRTILVHDPETKRRTDTIIPPGPLREALRARVASRIVPMIKRAFMVEITRIERFIVAAYDAADRGFFKMHRDNTTAGTAHRRFAVTINLNAEDHDGGELMFPEYGGRRYKAPTGGAIVFSCALLHQAEPVTRGTRYATLPFLYDESAVPLRIAANASLGPGVTPYRDDGEDRLVPGKLHRQ